MKNGVYRNPKNTKQEVKLWIAPLMDIGIVGGCLFLAMILNNALMLPAVLPIILYILFGLFGLFLCLRTAQSPIDRMAKVLYHIAKRDRNRYHPL